MVIKKSTWVTKEMLTKLRQILRACPDKNVREEGLGCLRNAKPEYLSNLIKSNHPDRIAAIRWIEENSDEIKNPAAVALGRLGGSVSSDRKTAAVRENAKKGGRPKYTFESRYEAHLGLTGRQTCIVPDQVADDQRAYDGKTFPAIIQEGYNSGKKIRVLLVGDDYGLNTSGTGEMVVRRA